MAQPSNPRLEAYKKLVRSNPMTTPKPKATPNSQQQIRKAEEEFKKMIKSGKVKDLESARARVKQKYGVRPNGMTN